MAIPLSASQVRLLENVPFSNDYKHTRYFTSQSAQTTYFMSKPTARVSGSTNFQKIEGKYYVAVDTPIEKLWKVNYMMFRNAEYEDQWFYAFVTQIEYKNRSTTYVYFEIDVFQTFWWDISFKPSYVAREHKSLWDSNGRPLINTLSEGLDYGSDYEVVSSRQVRVYDNLKWLVIGSKRTLDDDNEIRARTIGTPTPITYYVVPFTDTGGGYFINYYPTTIGGGDVSTVTDNPRVVLEALYSNPNSVNEIVTIYVTDYIGIDVTKYEGNTIGLGRGNPLRPVSINDVALLQVAGGIGFSAHRFEDKEITVGTGKYEGFLGLSESKLLMYPYSFTEITDFKGNSLIVKNEYIEGNDLTLVVKGSVGTENKVAWGVKNYNLRSAPNYNTSMISYQHSLIDDNTNDIAIINEYLSAYLQGNKNSIRNQKQGSFFSGLLRTGAGVGATIVGAKTANPTMVAGGVTTALGGMGSSFFDIQGLQAKEKDADNTPPSLAKMGGNSAFDYGNAYNGIWVLKKQIKAEYRSKFHSFFRMFGYKTDLVKYPNFRTRQAYNYVQTNSCNITGNLNNEHLQKLKTVFDNGITFWHNDDVGNYNQDNEVR